MIRRCAALALTLALASTVVTQTFVVDAANGPGTHFTAITTAIASVPDGALLIVRAGVYGPFTISDRSLTVLGAPGVVVHTTTFGAPIVIQNISSTKSVTLRGITYSSVFGGQQNALACVSSVGTIVLDQCVPAAGASAGFGRLSVVDCDRVFARNMPLAAPDSTVFAVSSNLVIEDSVLRSDGLVLSQGGGRVQLSGCRLESTGAATFNLPLVMTLSGSQLLLNRGSMLVGSTNGPGLAVSGQGTVSLDPATSLTGLTNPAFENGVTATTRAIPGLSAVTQAFGGVATADLAVPPAGIGVLLVGAVATPNTVPWAQDPLWLAAGSAVTALGGGPVLTSSYAIPNAPWVQGIQVAWQGAVLSGGTIALSNPSVYAHF